MSLISVVIPAYNQSAYLAEAVSSALAQTHRDLEVIVVDDGSTDGTPDILRAFTDRANVTVIRQANGGLPAARNRGLAAAQGQYVCFLDSDDALAPAHLARLASPLDADPSLGFAYSDVQLVDGSGAAAGTFSVGESRRALSGDIFESLLVGGYFPPHTVLVRKRLLDELGGFDLGLGGHADYELWLRLSAAGHRALYVDERLARYRVYAGTMSHDRDHMRETRVAALDRIARRFPDRLAAGLAQVQDSGLDLHTANQWLRERWSSALADLAALTPEITWRLMDHVDDVRLIEGGADQMAVWDTTLGGSPVRALFLHPPARVTVSVPDGRAGRLSATVGIHPDAWIKPDSCACTFVVSIDTSSAATVLADPRQRREDRRWLTVTLDVPATDLGAHVVTLETQAVGQPYFGWALIKDVEWVRSGNAG
jgi:glycosyltransferase involved in cell wall biosynthesis